MATNCGALVNQGCQAALVVHLSCCGGDGGRVRVGLDGNAG